MSQKERLQNKLDHVDKNFQKVIKNNGKLTNNINGLAGLRISDGKTKSKKTNEILLSDNKLDYINKIDNNFYCIIGEHSCTILLVIQIFDFNLVKQLPSIDEFKIEPIESPYYILITNQHDDSKLKDVIGN